MTESIKKGMEFFDKIELAAIIEFDEGQIEALGWETAEIDIILEDDQPDGSLVSGA